MSSKMRKTLHDGTKRHGYVRLNPETDEQAMPASDCNVIALFRKGPSVSKVKDKIRRNRAGKSR